jgi:hypothetical protein
VKPAVIVTLVAVVVTSANPGPHSPVIILIPVGLRKSRYHKSGHHSDRQYARLYPAHTFLRFFLTFPHTGPAPCRADHRRYRSLYRPLAKDSSGTIWGTVP